MSHPTITLEAAGRIIDAGQEKARDLGLNAVFAVLDAGANLVAFERMDGAWLASNDLALTKSRTSVMFEAPSEALNCTTADRRAGAALRPHQRWAPVDGRRRSDPGRKRPTHRRTRRLGWDPRAGCRGRPNRGRLGLVAEPRVPVAASRPAFPWEAVEENPLRQPPTGTLVVTTGHPWRSLDASRRNEIQPSSNTDQPLRISSEVASADHPAGQS